MTTTSSPQRLGFTLVEILVVIVIIGILAGLSLPAINRVIRSGNETALKLEVTSLADAVEKYQLQYGDYPPDMSSWTIAQRHIRKAFPRISAIDLTLLRNLCHTDQVPPSPAPASAGTFNPAAIDRSEAIVLFLGGFSSDEASPLTGAGGPFQQHRTPAAGETLSTPAIYQYNVTRDNAFFEFPVDRLTLADASPGSPVVSDDETAYSLAVDLLPAFQPDGREAPFVYFDSRSYASVPGLTGVYNGYWHPEFGGIRPYKDNVPVNAVGSYGTEPDASLRSWAFAAPKTFQIISAGADNRFGTAIWSPLSTSQSPTNVSANSPLYFINGTGRAMHVVSGATDFNATLINGIRGFQEAGNVSGVEENAHLDNVTSFSGSTIQSDLDSEST